MEEKREDKRGIFLGIIGVLTLIVAIIGASFAYFSVNARSSEDAVTITAASVKIVYADGQVVQASELIPSSQAVALETQRRALAGESYQKDGETINYEMCKDDKGYTVCGTYDFTLTNSAANAVDVTATIKPSETAPEIEFTNLKFILFDVTDVAETAEASDKNGTKVYEGTVGYEEFSILGSSLDTTVNIPGNDTTKKYRLFFWLNEAGEANNPEQGASFAGTINVDLSGANANITGNADSSMN